MNANEAELAEQKLDWHANLALYHQGLWLLLLAVLSTSNISHLKETCQCMSTCALFASFIAARFYIAAGKKVEKFKKFSPEEVDERTREYATRFFSPYPLWIGCIVWFS